ncbi:MAG: hypothetical protein HZC47_09730 [Methanobacterium sp.]|uniref:hypothetical protein n=1 Tax=Methanobacterium sp. TaxID=2164 RepID=UPI003D658518|nr:hypothetical protein [Methanobacterium sp.]
MKIEIPMFHDVWMDNGVEHLYRILKESDGVKTNLLSNKFEFEIIDKENFLKSFVKKIEEKRDSVIFIEEKNETTNEKRNLKKDFVLIQYGKKVDGRNVLKEKIYLNPEERINEIFDIINENGNNKCIICGKNYKKRVDNLKQAVYPLVTKIKSLNGIRSTREQYVELCPLCYLIGTLEWCDEGIIYRVFPKSHSFVLLPKVYDFKTLYESKSKWINTVLSGERFSNIKVSKNNYEEVEWTSSEYSTLLCFFEKFLNWVCLEDEGLMSFESAKSEVCEDWVYMSIPWGMVKNIKFEDLDIENEVMGIIYELIKDEKYVYGDFIKKILYFRKTPNGTTIDNDLTNQTRENLSKYFLMDDFNKFSNTFIPRKKGRISINKESRGVLENLVYLWRLQKMGFEKEDLETIKSVGNIVAEVSTKSIGLLYRLDKARSIEEFWNSLREISRKMISLEKPVKAKSINGLIEMMNEKRENWEEIKNLLVIYSCMYYYIKTL